MDEKILPLIISGHTKFPSSQVLWRNVEQLIRDLVFSMKRILKTLLVKRSTQPFRDAKETS
jgi:hypothetical protein